MARVIVIIALCGTLLAPISAAAGQQRNCTFEMAIFVNSRQATDLRVTIGVSGQAARVRVAASGEWDGRRQRFNSGADEVTFQTGAATEMIAISATGNALWQIDYRPEIRSEDRVLGFAGHCEPWREQ